MTTGSVSRQRSDIQSAPLPAPAVASAPAGQGAPVSTLPAPETVSASSGKDWKGWTGTGGTRVTVRQGDSLNSISRRYGVPVQAVASVNGIDNANQVKPGQSIIIPTYVYSDRNGHSSATEGENGKVKLPKVARNETIVTGSVPANSGSAPRPGRKPLSQPTFTQISVSESVVEEVDVVQVTALPKRKPAVSNAGLTTASISTATPAKTKNVAAPATAAPSAPVQKVALPQPALTQEPRPTEPIKTPK
ncbi:MAG: LysM peptidoglycan-binding domain-containing protein, partial [Pseudomonadota bacterium]